MHRSRPLGFLLAAAAFSSGASALILELLWGRELALVFGSSQYAVAAVLAVFMLGLGIGSRLGGPIADRTSRPAATLAALEVGLAVLGPALSLLLLAAPRLVVPLLPPAGTSADAVFLLPRLAVALALLLLPTLLMGATFPILVRARADSGPSLHLALGVLYAASTLGGVLGAVVAGFVLLPHWGIPGAVAAASASNLAAAAAAALAQRRLSARAKAGYGVGAPGRTPAWEPCPRHLLVASALSGAAVLAAETLWHRALLVVLPNSTFTLTLLLALVLIGLGIGGALARPLLRRGRFLRDWGVLQGSAALVIAVQLLLLPHLPQLVRTLRPPDGWARVLATPLVIGGGLLLPLTLVLGAAWPLLLAAAAPRLSDGGRRVGVMGFANAVGAALGAAVAGFVVLPALGLGRSLLAVAAVHLALLWHVFRRRDRRLPTVVAATACLLAVALAALAPRFGRVVLPSRAGSPAEAEESVWYRESASGTVTVLRDRRSGAHSMYVDNNAVIGTTYDALKTARMLGLLPALLHPEPRSALVIGFGAGVTTSVLAYSPEVESVEAVEIVPAVLEAAPFFAHVNHRCDRLPHVRILFNDGRNHLVLARERYDIITCDPVHPLFGSAPLYSVDFFRLCRQRLAPGGIACQYLPLHRMPTREFRRAIATFQDVFPETWVLFGLGHAMLVGSDRPLSLDWQRWDERLRAHPLQPDLADSALARPAQIAALLQLGPDECRAVGLGPPSSDLRPFLEFLAPAAYRPGLWDANARLLVESYVSPLDRVEGLPPGLAPHLRRLVAGKRLLLFSLLRREAGDARGALEWLRRAEAVAGDDPEVSRYGQQLRAEIAGGRSR